MNAKFETQSRSSAEIRVQIALSKLDQVGRKATRIFHLGVLEPQDSDNSIEPEKFMDLPSFRTTTLVILPLIFCIREGRTTTS